MSVVASEPTVSVVIPVWGEYLECFLEEALASIRDQGENIEVIVVDNACDSPVQSSGEGVVVVRSSSRVTCGAARNLGLERAAAPLVMMWDADDVMLPGTIEFLSGRMAADSGIVASAAAIEEEPGCRHRWPRRYIRLLSRFPRLFALINSVWSHYPTNGATLMRTQVVRRAGGYPDVQYPEDWLLGVALLWRGRVGWSERPGRLYRRHGGSTTTRHSTKRHLLAHARAVRELLREDSAVPAWVLRASPLIQLVQYGIIFITRPAIARVASVRAPVVPRRRRASMIRSRERTA